MTAAAATRAGARVSDAEFDRQLQTYLDAGYPALAGIDEDAFVALVEPLRDKAARATASSPDRIPFALVVTSRLVTADRALPTVHWKATTGWTEYTADDLAGYRPIEGVDVPDHAAYLVTDVDTGQATLDVRAKDAVPIIEAEGRTPADRRRGREPARPVAGDPEGAQRLLPPRRPRREQAGRGAVGQQGAPATGLVLGGQPAHLAGSASCGGRVA